MIDWYNEDVQENFKTLSQMLKANAIKDYIHYIDLATFKNFERASRINFVHPITVLAGKNGLGKSSCLHALYGVPLNKNIGTFWFSTAVDPIRERGSADRNRYYYGYGENRKEVLYSRIDRPGKPDYWETSRPLKLLGMKKIEDEGITRNSPVRKNVEYIDFRSELSPYDQYYYFSDFKKTTRMRTKQDFIRERSKFLEEVLRTNSYVKKWTKVIGYAPVELSEEELEVIKFILDKSYKKALSVKHSFFTKEFKESIIFYNNDFNYTEAHAGSGEISVVRIVRKIFSADENSLILLDEPEVSLHPEAQKRLILFLSRMAINKKLQIVISTHSTDIIEQFSKESIKLLFQPENGVKIKIIEDVQPVNVFSNLGRTLPTKEIVFVEDYLVKLIFEKIIQLSEDKEISSLKNSLEFKFYPGGESYLKTTFIPSTLHSSNATSVIFDGDQNKKIPLEKLKFSSNPNKKFVELKNVIEELTDIKFKSISFPLDSSQEKKLTLKIEIMEKYIEYFSEHVKYLPKLIPEDILWKENCVEYHISRIADKTFESFDELDVNSKEKIYQMCLAFEKKQTVSEREYQNMLEMLVRSWIEAKDEDYQYVLEILKHYSK